MTANVETVLATVDWSHHLMKACGKDSGYAMDKRARSGLFARYLRGDTAPSTKQLLAWSNIAGAFDRFHHPLYRVLAQPSTLWDDHYEILMDLVPVLECKVVGLDPHLHAFSICPATSRRLRDLAVQADGYALTALLVLALHAKSRDEPTQAMEAGVRAVQCLVFSLARGEFREIGIVVFARIRQQVVDIIEHDARAIDSASIALQEAVTATRAELCRRDLVGINVDGVARRQFFRAVLSGAEERDLLARVTPQVVSVEEAMLSRRLNREPTDLDSDPRGRFKQPGTLGAGARRTLRNAMGEYWCD